MIYIDDLLDRAADELEKWQEYEGFLAEEGLIEELRDAAMRLRKGIKYEHVQPNCSD